MKIASIILIFLSSYLINVVYSYPGSKPNDDLNIHKWDRKRRCDQDFKKPCGLCEGVGGICWGDKNKNCNIARCIPMKNSSVINPPDPYWGEQFQYRKGYNEVLIGEKNDPFCFQSFPGASPDKKFCYKPESGEFYYDMKKEKALQFNLEMKLLNIPKNISSTVIHQGLNFWIANKFWFGVEMCVCIGFKNLYPLNPSWVKTGKYIGREKIKVEYLWKYMVLDHWISGPHHYWTDIKTGQVIRMWQPWNGLEVLDPKYREKLNKTIKYPPPMCKKKGGAPFRINCDDNGFPATCNAAECQWDYDEKRQHRSLSDVSKEAMKAIQQIPFSFL